MCLSYELDHYKDRNIPLKTYPIFPRIVLSGTVKIKKKKKKTRSRDMAKWISGFATKLNDLSLIAGNPRSGGRA